MHTLNIPGFSAGSSLYKTSGHYVTRGHTPPLTAEIYPALQPRIGGIGGIGGGLNAWGCWDSCCRSHCAAGHYEAGPVGSVWVCDWRVCDEPCERCIWPW